MGEITFSESGSKGENILPKSFYTHPDVVQVAKNLLGKVLITEFDKRLTSGIIVETEAYAGITDKASHAHGGLRSKRTEIMYHEGGIAYIYLCYGIHSLFNVVTNIEGIPHAVLIRAIKPLEGINLMLERIGKNKLGKLSGIGPGRVCKLLGLHYSQTGTAITNDENGHPLEIRIEDRGINYDESKIISTPRIGVGYAGEDAKLPYRFCLTQKKIPE